MSHDESNTPLMLFQTSLLRWQAQWKAEQAAATQQPSHPTQVRRSLRPRRGVARSSRVTSTAR